MHTSSKTGAGAASRVGVDAAAVREALRRLLRGSPAGRLSAGSESALREALLWHEVLLDVGPGLAASPGLDVVKAAHARGRRDLVLKSLVAQADLRWLDALLRDLDAPWALMKGLAVAHTAYPDPRARDFGDVDVLVRPTDLPRVVDALEEQGCLPQDTDWATLDASDSGEMAMRLPHGSALDLHWHVVNDAGKRRSVSVPTDELVDRRRTVRIGGSALPVLSAEDQYLHVALHAYISAGRRLKWCRDLALTAARVESWHAVRDRSLAWGVAPAVATMADRAERALGVPAGSAELQPVRPRWSHVLRLTDRWYGPERAHEHLFGHTGTELLWATRETLPQSLLALARERRPPPSVAGTVDPTAARQRWLGRRAAGGSGT